VWRTVQNDDWYRYAPRAVSRRGACNGRSYERTGAVGFSVVTETIEHIKSGKLRALAVTTAARSEVLPDVPTIGEFVPGYEASAWVGIGAPRNTPAEIIEKLNADINAGLTDPKLKARFAELGATVFVGSPADFGRFIADETEKWAKVVKFAGIKPN
jgi:tripartite-type tricarboxylate transporter receptor subunit TctC